MIPSKPYVTGKVHGTIPAINRDTGVKMLVRQDMIDHDPAVWELITPEEFSSIGMTREQPKAASALPMPDKPVVKDSTESGSPAEVSVIMTKAGKPYKTEIAAIPPYFSNKRPPKASYRPCACVATPTCYN